MKLFDSVLMKAPKLNKFDLSHEKKLSLNMGGLYPILINEVVPGDKFRVNTEILMRFAPMLAPMMHRVNIHCHYFFVPNRLIWDEWEDFITGGKDGQLKPVWPYMYAPEGGKDYWGTGGLADYLGIPPYDDAVVGPTALFNVSALPFRAYQLIYDQYYRDQNLTDSIEISKASGKVDFATMQGEFAKLVSLRYRAWEKDYFTSALPWSQRGGDVLLPTDVQYKTPARVLQNGLPVDGGVTGTRGYLTPNVNGTGDLEMSEIPSGNEKGNLTIDNIDSFSTTINDLRKSVRLQEFLEKMARGGARYVEQMRTMFGVISSDARLQRVEFLGGGIQPVVVSEVLSTYTNTADSIPQGNMAGHGISVGSENGFKKRFEEHGFVMGIMSVLPKTAYQQGIEKMFLRDDRFKYYWPDFAHLGEQEVQNQELYVDYKDVDGWNKGISTFGYQSRYCEYKYKPSTVHGNFRGNMSFWHMGRIFDAPPVLNQSFVQADPTNRIFAVTDPTEHHLYCQLYNRVDALRPMPYFGTPRL